MDSNYVLLAAGSFLIVISYLLEKAVKHIKIPSVIILILIGALTNIVGNYYHFYLLRIDSFIKPLGVLGLILIVLEGTMDLTISKQKLPLISKSLSAAFLTLIISILVISSMMYLFLDVNYKTVVVNIIPITIISSAVAISSVISLPHQKKEFVIYESSFSDILGIMVFNFVIQDSIMSFSSVTGFLGQLILIAIVSIVCCGFTLFVISQVTKGVKFFLIISVLIFVYSIGHIFHLSSLLLIMVFGLLINNRKYFLKGRVAEFFPPRIVTKEVFQLKSISSELAFLIRTFFFFLFGYNMNLTDLLDWKVWVIGIALMGMIVFVRYIYLKFVVKIPLKPILYIAPRGLITILLFYSIPSKFLIPHQSEGILLVIILLSNLVMVYGLISSNKSIEAVEKSISHPHAEEEEKVLSE